MTPTISYRTLIALFLFSSCSTTTPVVDVPEINMAVKPGTTLPADASITVVNSLTWSDVTGAGGLIINRLMNHGFNVISPSTSNEIGPGYVLEFGGKYYLDRIRLPRHYDFTSFTASLVDISTGEILVSANFVGNKPVEEVCTEFVDMMVERTREK